ncbi:carboxypeptidase-like regulatory domain-containing protein [Myxococcaceae bacterium GXIMD 01537]
MQRRATASGWAPLALTFLLSACSGSKKPDDNPGTPTGEDLTPLTLSGTVLDTQGKPLAGATVIIDPPMHKGAVVVHTGADGRYKAESLPDVPYTVKAWKELTFNGERYCLRLGMPNVADYDTFNVRSGAVRNFRWQLTGPIETAPSSLWYFGALTRLELTGNFGGGTLELKFTPTSTLLDGSTASTFTRSLPVGQGRSLEVIDVPVASYTVSGTLVQGSNRRDVHIGTREAQAFAEQSDTAALVFHPEGNCVDLNGVSTPYLFVNSPDDE